MTKKLKEKWSEHWLKLAVVGFVSACTLLYSQQNHIIAGQGAMIEKSCSEMTKKIDQKVDNVVLKEMIKTINVKLDYDADRWADQQAINKETSEALQNLNVNVILLNEKLNGKE